MNYKTGESHWVIDSGCTQHMTGDPRMFTSLDEEVVDKKESHLEIIQRARLKDWAKWQSQMIIQSQICYMLLH